LQDAGIAAKDIQTSRFSIQPVYTPADPHNESKLAGYSVSNQVNVTIRDIGKAGDILDRLATAGVTNVGNIEFLHSDPSTMAGWPRQFGSSLDAPMKLAPIGPAGEDVLMVPQAGGEISALLQYEWGKRGCERPAYAPIVGAGLNSSVLHYSDDSGPINAGDLILIDAAGEYSMYASDITRTLPASGKFTPRQREIYEIALGAQNAAIAAFQSGKSMLSRDRPNSLYQVAYDYIDSHGKDSHGERLGKYFNHGLSHYVGLNVHDEGDYDVPVGPGMVFTIEPGIYIPEEKLGVRIEDMYYVDTGGKLVKLSAGLPSQATDVERIMAGK